MKAKHLTIALVASVFLGVGVATTTNPVQASTASKWGATKLYTTPKATRGTWYSYQSGKIVKFKVTAHTLGKAKLYKYPKNFSSLLNKLQKMPSSKQEKVRKSFSDIAQAYTEDDYHGIRAINLQAWLPPMGYGTHYIPVTRTRNGVKTRALRIDYGAGHVLWYYAYPSKKLAAPAKKAKTSTAAKWGATKVYTTPKATRGTWYYKQNGKINKLTITAHTVNGKKLYKVLSVKQSEKMEDKFYKLSDSKQKTLFKYFDTKIQEAKTVKWHGIASLNHRMWLVGNGSGPVYTPVTRTRHGVKTKALRCGAGARNWLQFYAYPTKSLAK